MFTLDTGRLFPEVLETVELSEIRYGLRIRLVTPEASEVEALVARDGGIDWACLERFDADPTFSRFLDRTRGGYFTLQPAERFETARQYVSRTNILETTFTTHALST